MTLTCRSLGVCSSGPVEDTEDAIAALSVSLCCCKNHMPEQMQKFCEALQQNSKEHHDAFIVLIVELRRSVFFLVRGNTHSRLGFISTVERPPKAPIPTWGRPMSTLGGRQSVIFE